MSEGCIAPSSFFREIIKTGENVCESQNVFVHVYYSTIFTIYTLYVRLCVCACVCVCAFWVDDKIFLCAFSAALKRCKRAQP